MRGSLREVGEEDIESDKEDELAENDADAYWSESITAILKQTTNSYIRKLSNIIKQGFLPKTILNIN